jgi:hypothetical protein
MSHKRAESKSTLVAVTCFLLVGCTTAVAQKKNLCGPEPLARCHQPPTCTPDGWVPGPLLPKGSGCETTSMQLGQCDAVGVCHTLPPPTTGFVAPAYYLVTILYAPPGNKSKASYFAGSSAGTTTNTANLFGIGSKVGITGNVIATANYQFTQQSAQSFQVTKTTKTELDTNSVVDPIRHGQDAFYLWVNPVINYTQQQSPGEPINISLGTTGGANMTVVELTADELSHKETIPDYKLQQLHNFTDADFAQILSANPWVASPTYQPDPRRFIKVTSLQLDGPDNTGDNPPGQGASVDDTQVACVTNTISQSIGSDFGGAVGVDFFGQGEKATMVYTVTWTNTNSAGNCNGASQTATVDLSSTTVGYHDVIDVYEDSIYHSFAYVSETQGVGLKVASADVTGVVKNSGGKPVVNQPITVKFADGSTREIFSNAQGKYRIFRVPPGTVTLTSGGSVSTAKFVSGQPTVKDLTVVGRVLAPATTR